MSRGKTGRFFELLRNNEIFWDSILGTLFIFSLILLFQAYRFIGELSFFDPIGDAIGDVEFTDIVFSELRDQPEVDTTVILVNIGNLNRFDIARQIEIINKYDPSIVAIDGYFWSPKDEAGDEKLRKALSEVNQLVLASKLVYNTETDSYDSIKSSYMRFKRGMEGFANLETTAKEQYEFKVCRSFPTQKEINGANHLSFGVQVSYLYEPEATEQFLDRGNEFETINYRGNVMDFGQTRFGGRYLALDVNDVLQERFHPDVLQGKIVLMGYLGDDFSDKSWEDKFFTPLNIKYAGRSNPDMFGVVIHANIISMILKGDYINRQSDRSGIIWAIIICFANVWFFTIIYKRTPHWYDGLTKTIQVLEVLFILTINVFIFHWFKYKTNLTLATITVALASDALEVCYGVLMNLFSRDGRREIFKIHRETKLQRS